MLQATSKPRVGRVPRTEEHALRAGEEIRTVHREIEEGRNKGEWLEELEGQQYMHASILLDIHTQNLAHRLHTG